MPTPEININQIIVGIIASVGSPAFIFICYKIYQIFSKPTQIEIEANQKLAKSDFERLQELIELQGNKADLGFRNMADGIREMKHEIKSDVKDLSDKVNHSSETLGRHDERILRVEKDVLGISIRLAKEFGSN